MSIEQTTPQEAKALLDENPDAIYLDVRSVQEFVQGHPEGAINIPLLDYDPESGQMQPNADFPNVVSQVLASDKTYVVGCKSGGRSQRACEILHQLGFQELYNVDGGFHGNDRQEGWHSLGLPVSTDNGDGVSYESLNAKAKSS